MNLHVRSLGDIERHSDTIWLAAAHTLAGLTQSEVAVRSNVSVPTLKRMEASDGIVMGMANNIDAVVRALEAAGVEFIPENGRGAGGRLSSRGLHHGN